MSFKITWKMHLICLLIGSIIALVLFRPFYSILEEMMLSSVVNQISKYMLLNFYIFLFAIILLVSVVHELLHGACYILFGGKVKYGFKFIYAYSMEISGKPLNQLQFVTVLLAPLIIISLLALSYGSWLGGIIYMVNLLGSVGDIIMALVVCKYDGSIRIIDRKYGFDILDHMSS